MRVIGIAVLALVGSLGSGCNYWPGLPDVSILKTHYPVVNYVAPASSGGEKSRSKASGKSEPKAPETRISFHKGRPSGWVGIDEVAKVAVGAIVVSEDWAFYQHKGYDPNQIREAIKEDIEEGRFARGASTITQQVAKNVFLESDKNLIRKIKEFVLALRMEENLKKRKILEIYLNIAEWGHGIHGIGRASQHYFGKPPSQLTAKEGAFLAMLLPSPKRYSQSFRAKGLTQYARKTVNSILGKMVQAKYITEEEKISEQARLLSFEAVDAPITVEGDESVQEI